MSMDELSTYTFLTKYARYNKDLHRRETFEEATKRVFDMHRDYYKGVGIDAEIAEAEKAVLDRLVLGSQRALQFGGKPIIDKNARIYNCCATFIDRPEVFQETMWLLLCGCGAGFSVQRHHVAKLPRIAKRELGEKIYVIPDSIEGWADALGVLLSSYFETNQPFPEYAGYKVKFDFSQIRKEGSKIGGTSGRAPGPKPLKRSLELIELLLDKRIAEGGSPISLDPIDAYDIIMHSSDAVLAGGVRRSATICLFSPDDNDMATAKTGDWFTKNPQRARSNNSALLIRDITDEKTFGKLMESVKEFGEPGFVWADTTEFVVNPCCEIGFYPVDERTGKTGWHFCNLTEINMKLCQDEATFYKACRASSILGTLQAGYNKFTYLTSATEYIVRRDALLGCSMTGMADSPDVAFNPEIQRKGAKLILDVNGLLAPKIGVSPCARATCVKPAGSTSCIFGSASGIHPHHSERYFRRVQTNKGEAPASYFQLHNPKAVEKSVWNPNGTDVVITFCVEAPDDADTKQLVHAVELLEKVKLTQMNWVDAGNRHSEKPGVETGISHNVSNTINVRQSEWGKVAKFIFANKQHFTGVSLLPDGGDLDYPQAPFTDVWTFDEIVDHYGTGSLFASGLIVDGLHAFGDLWTACDYVVGRNTLEEPSLEKAGNDLDKYRELVAKFVIKKDWLRRAEKFAQNYFSNNMRKMTHCLKRVNNCKQWEDITREHQPVDWTLLTEDEDNTKPTETIACAGGACIV